MPYQIINYFISLFLFLMTVVMLFAFRKPRRITVLSALVSGLISLVIPFLFLALSGQPVDVWLILPIFSFGLILGYLRGITMKLSFVGDQVVGKHSILFLLIWGFSLALNQGLSTLNSIFLLSIGVIVITFSAGIQTGFYGILALRRLVLIPPEMDTGRFRNRAVNRITNLGFAGLLGLFFLESLALGILSIMF
jgi:hypothetical protein